MIRSNFLALLAIGLLGAGVACGGGESPKSEASASAPAAATTGAVSTAASGGSTGTASFSGKVAYEGSVPPVERVKLNADPKCAAMHKEGLERWQLRVKDGGLADVLVYVKSGLHGTYPSSTDPVLLDQKGCDYWPHMVVKMVGQPLVIRNSDDTLHNIHPRPQVNPEFNIGQPHQGMESKKTMDKPEIMIPVGCDVHPWMRAFISVFDHPFFTVTKEDGSFEIKGLPAGEYEVEAYHGKLKTQDLKLTVKDGEAAKLNFSFKG
ncbi:MAG TPA: hypothetical protein VN375_03660 [Vicinamibacteria bacterium]|jgi:hypothetical protein|nr:hypothetical protein [Vicinamibacteria bacterium]